jgi:hypothetical protein
MKGSLALCWLAGLAVLVSTSQSLAQSGVFSGPPQVRPDSKDPGSGRDPGLGPDYRPGQGPNYRPDPGPGPVPGPGAGPNIRRQDATWIAVAAGFDPSGKRVSVGYSGHQRSRLDAENAAIRACNRNEPNVNCQNPLAVSTGCLYIVPGNRSGGSVRWGRGGTRQAAFEECRRGGFTCPGNKLIGGCVPGYN